MLKFSIYQQGCRAAMAAMAAMATIATIASMLLQVTLKKLFGIDLQELLPWDAGFADQKNFMWLKLFLKYTQA